MVIVRVLPEGDHLATKDVDAAWVSAQIVNPSAPPPAWSITKGLCTCPWPDKCSANVSAQLSFGHSTCATSIVCDTPHNRSKPKGSSYHTTLVSPECASTETKRRVSIPSNNGLARAPCPPHNECAKPATPTTAGASIPCALIGLDIATPRFSNPTM